MYKLTTDRVENNRRTKTFKNEKTGTEVKIVPIYTDASGLHWWGFTNLYSIPYIRTAYAKHIADMFTMGLSLKDILDWCKQERELLKSEDPEKYEKLFALVLEKEKLANYTADPIRQHLALATVYVLKEDEAVDQFSDEQAEEKLRLWGADVRAQSFFLNWLTEATQQFTKDFKKISQTVSRFQME